MDTESGDVTAPVLLCVHMHTFGPWFSLCIAVQSLQSPYLD